MLLSLIELPDNNEICKIEIRFTVSTTDSTNQCDTF